VSGLSRSMEKLLHGLRRRSVREEKRLFLAEGVRVVEDLIDSPLEIELAIAGPGLDRSGRGAALLERLADRTDVIHGSDADVRRVAATDSPQDIVVAARMPAVSLSDVTTADPAVALVLDAVQDPGNFGTLVRCADAFGVDLVIAMTGTVDPWNPKSVRAAAGAAFRVPIANAATAAALDWLDEHAFSVWAADAAGEPAASLEPPARIALVAGNEGAGISSEVAERAARRVAVPIRGRADSLNVAVATAILLFLLTGGTE
jgi:TrmH family RNA methyltransferase